MTRIMVWRSMSFKRKQISRVAGLIAKLCAFGPTKPSPILVTPVAAAWKIDSTPDSPAT